MFAPGALCLAAIAAAPVDYDAMGQRARALLSDLVAADTTNPPGNETRAAALGAAQLEAAGIPHRTYEFGAGRSNLVARLPGAGPDKPLLLLAHIDVVGTAGQTWSTDSHRLTEKDGFLVGRGVNDDLGMASLELEVFTALKASGMPLRRDVILAWTGDEESGGAGIRWMLAHERAAVDAAVALNEGGGLALGDDGKVMLVSVQEAEKTYQDFTLATKGTTGHSSVPLEDNAIYRLARALERVGRLRFPARLLEVSRGYLAQRAAVETPPVAAALRALVSARGRLPEEPLRVLDADPVLASTLRTTCVATMLSGGTRVNALPAQAQANVNCRILPDERIADVQQALAKAIDDPGVLVQPVDEFGQAGASPVAGEVPDAVRSVVARMWPGVAVTPFLSRGATDSRFLRQAGIPAYGIDPLPVTEAEGRRAHGVDERIPVASLRTGAEFLYRLVLELAAKR